MFQITDLSVYYFTKNISVYSGAQCDLPYICCLDLYLSLGSTSSGYCPFRISYLSPIFGPTVTLRAHLLQSDHITPTNIFILMVTLFNRASYIEINCRVPESINLLSHSHIDTPYIWYELNLTVKDFSALPLVFLTCL